MEDLKPIPFLCRILLHKWSVWSEKYIVGCGVRRYEQEAKCLACKEVRVRDCGSAERRFLDTGEAVKL